MTPSGLSRGIRSLTCSAVEPSCSPTTALTSRDWAHSSEMAGGGPEGAFREQGKRACQDYRRRRERGGPRRVFFFLRLTAWGAWVGSGRPSLPCSTAETTC